MVLAPQAKMGVRPGVGIRVRAISIEMGNPPRDGAPSDQH